MVKVMRKCYTRIEELEADATNDKSMLPTAMKGRLEFAIQAAYGYERALEKVLQTRPGTLLLNQLELQKSNTDNLLVSFESTQSTQETQARRSSGRVRRPNVALRDNVENETAVSNRDQCLEELQERQRNLIDQIQEISTKNLETELHIMEQIYHCKKMREEFEAGT